MLLSRRESSFLLFAGMMLFLLTCVIAPAFGAAYSSAGSGDWDADATWNEAGFPDGTDDTATIDNTHTVTNSGAEVCGGLTINNGGTLEIDAATTLSVAGDFAIADGGALTNAGTLIFNGGIVQTVTDNNTTTNLLGAVETSGASTDLQTGSSIAATALRTKSSSKFTIMTGHEVCVSATTTVDIATELELQGSAIFDCVGNIAVSGTLDCGACSVAWPTNGGSQWTLKCGGSVVINGALYAKGADSDNHALMTEHSTVGADWRLISSTSGDIYLYMKYVDMTFGEMQMQGRKYTIDFSYCTFDGSGAGWYGAYFGSLPGSVVIQIKSCEFIGSAGVGAVVLTDLKYVPHRFDDCMFIGGRSDPTTYGTAGISAGHRAYVVFNGCTFSNSTVGMYNSVITPSSYIWIHDAAGWNGSAESNTVRVFGTVSTSTIDDDCDLDATDALYTMPLNNSGDPDTTVVTVDEDTQVAMVAIGSNTFLYCTNTLTVAGSWTNIGTFVSTSSTVTFVDSAIVYNNDQPFNNLTANAGAGKTVILADSSVSAVSNLLTVMSGICRTDDIIDQVPTGGGTWVRSGGGTNTIACGVAPQIAAGAALDTGNRAGTLFMVM